MKQFLVKVFLFCMLFVSGQEKNDLQGTYGLGTWIPIHQIDVLGQHPFLSVGIGKWQSDRFYWECGGEFRVLKSKKDYEFIYKGTPMTGNKYFSFYLGGEIGFKVLDLRKTAFELFGGLGYDRLDFKKPEGIIFLRDINIYGAAHTPNLNFGLNINILLNNKSSIGLMIKYNLVDYTFLNKTSLYGNVVEIGLKYRLFGEHFNKEK
jgi:hypothetical protein